MNRSLIFRSAEMLAVSTGAVMGVSALAALPWWLSLIGIGFAGGAWAMLYQILKQVRNYEV